MTTYIISISEPENEISASNNNIDVLHDNTFINEVKKLQSEITVLQEKLKLSDGKVINAQITIDNLNQQLSDSFAKLKVSEMELSNEKLEVKVLSSQVDEFQHKISFLELEFESTQVMSKIKKDMNGCKFYTGINSFERLWTLCNFVIKFIPPQHSLCKLDYATQFVITLIRLRLNLTMQDLAYRFNISLCTCSKYITFWLHAMHKTLVPAFIRWPKQENVRKTMPLCFRDRFYRCICVIDCFEIFLDRPTKIKERASTFSTYKSHNTVKFLIAITPQGYISYVSKAYGGRISDKFIVEDCEFLDKLILRDIVLADRGFTVHEAVSLQNAELKIPSFLGKRNQLTNLEVEMSRDLARVRIHVERIIGAIKQRYSILHCTLNHQCTDLSGTDEERISIIDQMVNVACALYNACPSVVPII